MKHEMLEAVCFENLRKTISGTNDGHFGGEKKASGKYESTIVNGGASA